MIIEYKFSDGTKAWYKNNKLHRDDDLPAVIWADGTKLWYQNGVLHRDNNLPAVIFADGKEEWYQFGSIISIPSWIDLGF